MPQQETFFEQTINGRHVEVVKTYDQSYAREAFDNMGEEAHAHLWNSLKPEEIYDSAGPLSVEQQSDLEAFLWEELVDQAREDWNSFSFFIVNETIGTRSSLLYVSPDWPSAESFAKTHTASAR